MSKGKPRTNPLGRSVRFRGGFLRFYAGRRQVAKVPGWRYDAMSWPLLGLKTRWYAGLPEALLLLKLRLHAEGRLELSKPYRWKDYENP